MKIIILIFMIGILFVFGCSQQAPSPSPVPQQTPGPTPQPQPTPASEPPQISEEISEAAPQQYALAVDVKLPTTPYISFGTPAYKIGEKFEGGEYSLDYVGKPFRGIILYEYSRTGVESKYEKKYYTLTRGVIRNDNMDYLKQELNAFKLNKNEYVAAQDAFSEYGTYNFGIYVYDCASAKNALKKECKEIELDDLTELVKTKPLQSHSKSIVAIGEIPPSNYNCTALVTLQEALQNCFLNPSDAINPELQYILNEGNYQTCNYKSNNEILLELSDWDNKNQAQLPAGARSPGGYEYDPSRVLEEDYEFDYWVVDQEGSPTIEGKVVTILGEVWNLEHSKNSLQTNGCGLDEQTEITNNLLRNRIK